MNRGHAEALLEIRDLSVSLPRGGDRGFAVSGVSITVAPGEIVCVVGESGSGKSVLANAAMRLLPPSLEAKSGRILFEGQDLAVLSAEQMRELRGRRMAMIFQEPMTALNPVLTVGEQIDEALAVHGFGDSTTRGKRVLELLESMHLPDPGTLRGRYPFQLSGGQRQRVMIAMAMALEPRLLIADEPTTALDVTTQAQVLSLIRELRQRSGIGVLFITHDFGVVADLADRVVVMQTGRVVEAGPASRVLEAPADPYTRKLIAAVPRLADRRLQAQTREPLLVIRGLSKQYAARRSFFKRERAGVRAVDDVSLEIGRGETLGLVGESGSGKTTLGQIVARLIEPDGGSMRFDGVDLGKLRGRALRALRPRIQMVFQDPFASLNPRHRIRRIVTESAILAGVDPEEANRRLLETLERVGLEASAADRFPHEFSGGQRQRIGIARALVMRPELIVADEPVSALDVSVQAQVLELLEQIRRDLGLALLFITHDLRVASQLCDRVAVMQRGRIVEIGTPGTIFRQPAHEYTRSLIAAIPGQEWEIRRAA
ncbi:ABC transporter ATP-binding protein [Zeimonas arvi]|nr:ABC transporter ATP-binding protein [Zeimonas arvi]